MALIKSVRGFTPQIGKDTFLADNATIIGDVEIGEGCSIWFGTVLRGDVNSIRIGNGVNIQDGSVLHTLYEKSTIEIGDDVSVGHNVTIHGAKICNGALIGMGSVVLDHAVIGEGAIVAAGSVVLSKTIVEPGSIYAGVPAKFVKKVDPEQAKEINQKIAKTITCTHLGIKKSTDPLSRDRINNTIANERVQIHPAGPGRDDYRSDDRHHPMRRIRIESFRHTSE